MPVQELKTDIKRICEETGFSGAVHVKQGKNHIIQSAYGYSDRSNAVKNDFHTRFGIASGCKLFTSICVCQLVQAGKLSFSDRLTALLDYSFPAFDTNVTIHHLLTHTSGVPDYFDEDVMDDFEELWAGVPMYKVRNLTDFLPLFQDKLMLFQPGDRFHYNNAGYILLGLVIEKVSGMTFSDYVEKNVFKRAGMERSGYFSFDRLPANTAAGYIDSEKDGSWRTNVYSLPAKGGSDGGAYTTAEEMAVCWSQLMTNRLLDSEHTKLLLEPQVTVDDEKGAFYGYGVWISRKQGRIKKYHVMGYDPGVCFHSAYYPDKETFFTALSNKESGAFEVMQKFEEAYTESL